MHLSEILEFVGDLTGPVEIRSAYLYEIYPVINSHVALKVIGKSNSYSEVNNIPITLNGITHGELIFLKCKNEIEISSMNEYEFISFLTFGNKLDYNLPNYKFGFDVLIIKEDFLINYIEDSMNTSLLWGGFVHEETVLAIPPVYKISPLRIELGDKLKVLDNFSLENAFRAIQQPLAFERYLKQYHLLELQFDYSIIQKIKNLNIPEDSNKIGKILNDYTHNEIDRLVELLKDNCTDILSIEAAMYKIIGHQIVATDMFVNFAKSNNAKYLTDIIEFQKLFSLPNFSLNELKGAKIKGYDFSNHNTFIIGLTAFWIYKMRCSVAHSKIGEYILTSSDEKFIVEFGEPLLKEILKQFYKL